MSDPNLANTIVSKLLDWPFLFFVLVLGAIFRFRAEIATWVGRVSEVELGDGKLKFKIGKDEVSLERLDSTITARLRELQEEIEVLRNAVAQPKLASASAEGTNSDEIPEGLKALLVKQVYPMLESKLWLGRYVQTLAKAAAVSEDLMLKFCRERDDIGLFKDGDRWVAALTSRLNKTS